MIYNFLNIFYRFSRFLKLFASLIFFIIIINYSIKAQIPDSTNKIQKKHLFIYAGMGLGYTSTPSLNDYIRNEVAGGTYDSVKSFSAGLEIFGGLDYELTKKFSVRFDYSYFFKSKTYYISYFTYDYYYDIHQPFIIANYIISGNNYSLKLGGGIGYHFAQLQKTVTNGPEIKYNSAGPALKGEVLFSTKLSSRINTYISGFLMGSFLGTLKDSNNNPLRNSQTKQDVNLGSFGLGVRLGFSINIF